MTDLEKTNDEIWPLEGIKTTTILKVDHFAVDHHKGENPYIQFSIGGFVLIDCSGAVLFTDIQLSADDGDTEEVERLRKLLSPNSLHWIESTAFYFSDRTVSFYNPMLSPIGSNTSDIINEFFPVPLAEERDPGDGEFYYAGRIFVEGKGKFMGFKRWDR